MKINNEDKGLTKLILEILYLDELKDITYRFDIPRTGNKAQIIKNIMKCGLSQKDLISSLKVDGLRSLCDDLNIKTGKKKEEMIASILQFIKEESDSSNGAKIEANITRKPIDKNIRHIVWRRYWGNSMDGQCWVNGIPIQVENFECGHIISVANGGDDNILNLIPLCRGCNLGMKEENLFDYKKRYFSHINVPSLVQPEDIRDIHDYSNNNKQYADNNLNFNRKIRIRSPKNEVKDIYGDLPIFINPGDVITSFNLDGNKYNISTWKDLLLNVAEYVLNKDKRNVDKILDIKGSQGRKYFSKKSSDFYNPEQIEGTNIYLETKLDAENIVKRCYYIIRRFGYEDKDLNIYLVNDVASKIK